MSLNLGNGDRLGKGSHCSARRGHLQLPESLYSGGKISVAVKVTNNDPDDRLHLSNEAKTCCDA